MGQRQTGYHIANEIKSQTGVNLQRQLKASKLTEALLAPAASPKAKGVLIFSTNWIHPAASTTSKDVSIFSTNWIHPAASPKANNVTIFSID